MRNHIVLICACVILFCGAASAQASDYDIVTADSKAIVAKLYLPKKQGKVPVVIAFGGSEGGISTGEANGQMLAPHGVAVLALAYFKEQGLPQTLDQIPLEYFVSAVDYLASVPQVDASRIGIVSGSRGGEAALLLASIEPRIKSVVVTTPSSVAWFGRTLPKSAWTLDGKDVAALSLGLDDKAPLLTRFEAALESTDAREAAAIAVENINGPVLLISAENDQVWPSTRMANDIVKRLNAHGFRYKVIHRSYPTGHGFSQETAPAIKQSIIDHFVQTL